MAYPLIATGMAGACQPSILMAFVQPLTVECVETIRTGAAAPVIDIGFD